MKTKFKRLSAKCLGLITAVYSLTVPLPVQASTTAVDPSSYTDPNTAVQVHITGDAEAITSNTDPYQYSYSLPEVNTIVTDGAYCYNSGSVLDTTGSYTVNVDGDYIFELYGGSGSGAGLSCADSVMAMGGHGGYVKVKIPLKAGDVVSYTVGNGGAKALRLYSRAYDAGTFGSSEGPWSNYCHASFGANGRDTVVYVNGIEMARAYGGTGGVRLCCCWTDDSKQAYVVEKLTGYSPYMLNCDNFPTDDPAFGGGGGKYKVSSGVTVLSSLTGDKGDPYLRDNTHLSPVISDLTYQEWYRPWFDITARQLPGMLIISKVCDHTYGVPVGNCTTAGTMNKICTKCGGIQYGTVYVPAVGHDFQPIEVGTVPATTGSKYYATANNSSSNNVLSTYSGGANYYYSYRCTHCLQYAVPVPGYWHIAYHNPSPGTGSIPTQDVLYNSYANLSDGAGFNYTHSKLCGWSTDAGVLRILDPAVQYSLGQRVINLKNPSETLNLYAVWEPWWYRVTYHSNNAVKPEATTTRNDVRYIYDVEYPTLTEAEARSVSESFQRDGYYIYGWSNKPNGYVGYQCINNVGRTQGKATFSNLAPTESMAHLYAIWRGNPYYIKIHDNYVGCSCPVETIETCVGEEALLPRTVNKHGSTAVLLGYRLGTGEYVSTPEYKPDQLVKDLTLKAFDEVHFYRIWDEIPIIEAPSYIQITRKTAEQGMSFNPDGSVSWSEVETYLLNKITRVSDKEYTWADRIPNGHSHGYTVEIASFDPVTFKDNVKNTCNYIITYRVTDNVGNSAVAQTELLFGDPVTDKDGNIVTGEDGLPMWEEISILKDTH